MTHLIRGNRISTQWPHVHTMPGAALFRHAQKRRSVCEQIFVEGMLSITITMSLPTYIVELNKTNNEGKGQAGQIT